MTPWQPDRFLAGFAALELEVHTDHDGAMDVIGGDLLLAGHSLGGLVTSLYAREGAKRAQVQGLWLNSAFFDWNLPEWRKVQMHLATAVGRYYPFLNDPKAFRPDYTRALRAEWEFDSVLKHDYGFPVYYAWLGAVNDTVAEAPKRVYPA